MGDKDGSGPVMVSDTLCPAVYIFFILKFMLGTMSCQTSVCRLYRRIDPCASEEGVKGLRALGLRVPGPDGHSDVRSAGQTDGNSSLCSTGHHPL